MNFFIKFSKYPFAFARVKSSNSTNALKHAQHFRKDAVVVNPTELVFTFEQAVNFGLKWHEVNLKAIEDKEYYEVYDVNQDVPGLVVIEDTKRSLCINPNDVLDWCKKETQKRDGVIWVQDRRGIVFGNKKKNQLNPVLLFVKVEKPKQLM